MKKRFWTMFLALALCLGLTVPAFAETDSTVINGASEYFLGKYALEQQDIKSSSDSFVTQEIIVDFDSNPPHADGYYAITENVAWTISNTASDNFGVMISFRERYKEGNHYSTRNMCWILPDGTFSLAFKDENPEDFILKSGQSVTFTLKNAVSAMKVTADPSSLYEMEIMDSNYPGDGDSYLFKLGSNTNPDVTDEKPTSTAFTDTPSWCAKEAQWAAQQKITNGYGAKDKFAPGVDCTQAQILTFLWRAKNKPTSTATVFSDLAGDYAPAANWAYEEGIIGDSFNPNAPCTRAQAVTYIWKAQNEPDAKETASFSDVEPDSPIAPAVSWAVEKRVTKGYGGADTFAPSRVCSRGEIVCFLYRALHN